MIRLCLQCPCSTSFFFAPIFVPLILAAIPDRTARAVSEEAFTHVPADSLAAYFVAGPPQPLEGPATLESAAFLLHWVGDVGAITGLDATWRAWLDALGLTAVVLRHPHAVALLEVQARARPDGGHELDRLKAGLVVQTKGDHRLLEQRIQHLLNAYTNSDESSLELSAVLGNKVQTLRDRRLADWVVIQWGRIGDLYVITVGEGAFQRIAETLRQSEKSLGAVPWFQQACAESNAARSKFLGYLNFEAVARASDPQLREKISRVQSALHLEAAQRAVLSLGFEGRRVAILAFAQQGDRNQRKAVTLEGDDLAGVEDFVPPAATWYLPLDIQPRTWLSAVWNAYLASKSPSSQRQAQEAWVKLESAAGISIDQDIFAHLGRGVIVHNSPPHALKLPFAWTRLIRVSGDSDRLRSAIDSLFGVWRDWLEVKGTVRLKRAEDGVWYVHFGLDGPALLVTSKWVIISFSPQAVRENADYLATKTSD